MHGNFAPLLKNTPKRNRTVQQRRSGAAIVTDFRAKQKPLSTSGKNGSITKQGTEYPMRPRASPANAQHTDTPPLPCPQQKERRKSTPPHRCGKGRTPRCFVFHQTVFAIANKTRPGRVRLLYDQYDSMQIQ